MLVTVISNRCRVRHRESVGVRESSFNMTRGGEDTEGGLRKFLDTKKGGSEKIRGGS